MTNLRDLQYEYMRYRAGLNPYTVRSASFGVTLDGEYAFDHDTLARFYEDGRVMFYLDGYKARSACGSVKALVTYNGVEYPADILKRRDGTAEIKFYIPEPID